MNNKTESQLAYEGYLTSKHWTELSKAVKRRAGWRCQVCDSPHDLQAHHRKYDNRGKERLEDLICLCRRCHALFHGKMAPDGLKTPVWGISAKEPKRKRKKSEDIRKAIAQTKEVLDDMPDGTGDILLTKSLVSKCLTEAGGFTNETLRHLGVTRPLVKGWRHRLSGQIISREQYQAALVGRYLHNTGPLPRAD